MRKKTAFLITVKGFHHMVRKNYKLCKVIVIFRVHRHKYQTKSMPHCENNPFNTLVLLYVIKLLKIYFRVTY